MTEMDAQRAHMGTMPVHDGLPQSAMATQSPEPLAVKTDIIPDYYPMVPKSAVNSSQQSFYNPNFSAINPPFQSPAMSQTTMWASPRSSVDDFDNYSYRAPAPTSGYHAGSLSPRTWPDSVQTPPPQYEVPFHHQEQYDGITGESLTMTSDNLRGSSMNISIDYGNGCFQPPLSGPHDPFPSKYESPPPMNTTCGPFVASPTSIQESFKPENHPSMSPSPCPSVTPGGIASGSMDVEKDDSDKKKTSDEPYAQLIWRALKEQDSRSMTLQELYQWFLANTDKPEKAGGNGWHNSIRHNLSMNKAFERIEVIPRHSINGSSTEKNPSKWHLTPAFEDGVKSTTHYRPGPRGPSGARRNNGNQRRSYHSSPEFPDRIIPGRAISGRKGGRATSRSRNAARDLRIRTNLQEQQQWNPPPPPPHAAAAAQRSLSASQLDSSYPTWFNQHQHSQNAQRFLRAHGRQREEAARSNGIPGIPIRSAGPAVPPQQPYQVPGYTMANVAGVYQHPHPQQPQQQFQQPQQQQQPRPGQQSEEVLYSGWGTSTANQGM